ncbi:MAG: BamA/TamA family outer membrane protein [Bacteroidetes bacterium]|nr:BamA/TamA family outer membrane protein [Bacteroidota bacterium]
MKGRLLQTLLLFAIGFFFVCPAGAQTKLVVDSIEVSGNKKTKEQIILREITISKGDTMDMANLSNILYVNRLRLMNTGLFSEVLFNVKTWDTETSRIGISIEVLEAWYVYPVPTFELADRNFNVWWVDYEHALDRVNFGFNLYYSNFTGRQDYLKVVTQFGFTNKFEIEYSYPYINRAQTLGLAGGFLISGNRTFNYITEGDKQVFYQEEEGPYLLRRIRGRLGMRYRPGLNFLHKWQLSYHNNRIDTIIAFGLNPDFFLGSSDQQFMAFEYDLSYDSRNVIAYPTKGMFWNLNLRKEGLGLWNNLNQLYFRAGMKPYFSFNDRLSAGLNLQGRLALNRAKQPFYNSRALGYESDFLRGYEFYVIDGLDYAFAKTDLRFKVLDTEINWGKMMPFNSLKIMSGKLFVNLFGDTGFANNPYYADGNQLPNQLLYSYGIGLDVLVYYNKLFQVQFSRNGLGEWGVFLHWELGV